MQQSLLMHDWNMLVMWELRQTNHSSCQKRKAAWPVWASGSRSHEGATKVPWAIKQQTHAPDHARKIRGCHPK